MEMSLEEGLKGTMRTRGALGPNEEAKLLRVEVGWKEAMGISE